MRKHALGTCENKDVDQLNGNLLISAFTHVDIPKSEISSLYPSCVVAQPGLCRTWSETTNNGFVVMLLNFDNDRVQTSISNKQDSMDVLDWAFGTSAHNSYNV